MEKTEKETTNAVGEFKTKRKYTGFVSALRGAKVRIIRETAFIKGKHLSGVLEGRTFKMTVREGNTVDFEEVSHSQDRAMLQRLIIDIDATPHTGYAQNFIVQDLHFEDQDGNPCYLEVEEKKPIDKLKSLFDDRPEISKKGMFLLDDLFGPSDDNDHVETETDAVEETATFHKPTNTTKESQSMLEESFKKMNEEKVRELKKREAELLQEINLHTRNIKTAEANIDKLNEKLSIMQSRLESMTPAEASNGHVFFVSQEKKIETGLDETTRAVADKIADIMKLKKEALFEYLTAGFYTISIAKKGEIEKDFEITPEMAQEIAAIDPSGNFSATGGAEIEYRGKLNWHQLVSKMIRRGFEQDDAFDRDCGSNSYGEKGE